MTYKAAKRIGSRPWESPLAELIEAKARIEAEIAKGKTVFESATSLSFYLSGLAITIEARQR